MSRHFLLFVLLASVVLVVGCSQDSVTPPGMLSPGEIESQIQAANQNPRVIPPHARPHGSSYAEWSVAWWQWLWSVPADINPSLYDDGDLISSGQSGSVWFIAPNFGGTNVRTGTIPAGKMLFIDVAAHFFSPVIGDPEGEEELRALAAAAVEATQDVWLEIDGVLIEGMEDYRVQSPEMFGFTLPEGNVLEMFGFDTPAGGYYPAVNDGYFVMLAPLPVGQHTIHIHAQLPDPWPPSDVLYNLEVVGN